MAMMIRDNVRAGTSEQKRSCSPRPAPSLWKDRMPSHPRQRRHTRTVTAAITMAGLKFALQTPSGTSYDTSRTRHAPPQVHVFMSESRLDTTFDLVERVKAGDDRALDVLFARHLAPLRRWASGRLPRWTRDLMDTDDIVQETVFRAIKRIDRFEARHEG